MKNLLIDFIPFQTVGGVGGAASFAKAIYDELFSSLPPDVHVMAAYDSTLPTTGRFDCQQLAKTWKITLVDISADTLASITQRLSVDTFFMAIAQFYTQYDLSGIACKVIMFIHDIYDWEKCDNRIDLVLSDRIIETRWLHVKRIINLCGGRWKKIHAKRYQKLMPLYIADNTKAYTVSEYSKYALEYYFPQCKDKISICYSPLKNKENGSAIDNRQLAELVESGKPYLLLLAANRIYKNASLLVKVFKRLHGDYPDLHMLTLKYGRSIGENHIDIDYLSDSDMEFAYQHSYMLVFASLLEGFGYPPIEAARHGVPTVASNVTSIPEILSYAGVYFSPFYPADLYRAIITMMRDRDKYAELSRKRYEEIVKRQQDDLKSLIAEILK